jgi:FixJ family two-component response regulator
MPIVHLVDDDPSFLTAVSRLLKASGYEVLPFTSASAFLQQHGTDTAGCVVADLQMPGLDGLGLQAALAATINPLPVLFLTGEGDITSTVRAMRSGAEDFLEKTAPKEALLDAVQRALARDARERGARCRHAALRARLEALTQREREVLGHVVQGRLNKQIAADLGIHERTVKLHRTAITTKLGVRSSAELARLVQQAGAAPQPEPTFP